MTSYPISFVIPAYNEENTIENVVEELAKKGLVIVVDDCSSDNTALKAEMSGAKVVKHKENMGYSAALNTGFEEAVIKYKSRGVITVDADGEHCLDQIDNFIFLLTKKNVPLILGIRSKKNRLIEVFIGIFIKFAYGISDIFCGMKAYQSSLYLAKNGFDLSNSAGTELALSCVRGGIEFEEVKINVKQRKDKSRYGNNLNTSIRLIVAITKALIQSPIKKSILKKN